MIVKYFADDGTEFTSEGECELYEQTIQHCKMPLMWKNNERPLMSAEILEGRESIGNVAFVFFRDKEEYENFCYWSDYFGYDYPEFGDDNYPKRFIWNDHDGYSSFWCDLDAEIKRLQDIRELFEKGA